MAPYSGLKEAEHFQSPTSRDISVIIIIPWNNVSVPLKDMKVKPVQWRHIFSNLSGSGIKSQPGTEPLKTWNE